MTTVLRASPRRFVSTPAIDRVATRALRYLQSGFSVHLRGPAGTGKTTLALHLADLIARPIMLLFGDDEYKTSDLIGNQSGYTRKKVVDNYIHSVIKVEDELRQNWVDSRLTLACREGFTLVYDEFNRSRPEVNNVLLSALEEKLLVLPPNHNRTEYIRVHPQFHAIFTSNPEEYCGVHDTQDALLDRLVTINIPEPDELTQQEIAIHKTSIDRESAAIIVRLVRAYRVRTGAEKSSGLRSCLFVAKICHEHGIVATPENSEFRDICQDVLLSRANIPLPEATQHLWDVFNELICGEVDHSQISVPANLPTDDAPLSNVRLGVTPNPQANLDSNGYPNDLSASPSSLTATLEHAASITPALIETAEVQAAEVETAEVEIAEVQAAEIPPNAVTPYEQPICSYLKRHPDSRPSEIEAALQISRFQVINSLQALTEQGILACKHQAGKPATYRVQSEEHRS